MGDRRERKLNISLFLACLFGALAGCLLSEILIMPLKINGIIRVGLYMAIVFLMIYLFGLICEMVTGHMNGGSWNGRQTGRSILFIILFPVLLGLLAALFQLIYQLNIGDVRGPSAIQDYLILVDNSSSVTWTDKNDERYDAVVDFVRTLDKSNKVLVRVFSDNSFKGSQYQFDLTEVGPETPDQIRAFFDSQRVLPSGTQLTEPLLEVLDAYQDQGRSAVALVLSDGEDEQLQISRIAEAYKKRGIPVYCASFAEEPDAAKNLQKLAADTNGEYYELNGLANLTRTVEQYIQQEAEPRNLLEARIGSDESNLLARIERIVFFTILGILAGLLFSFILDSRVIMEEALIGHIITALLSGCSLELLGQTGILTMPLARLIAMLLLGFLLVHYYKTSFAFDENETFGGGNGRGRGGRGRTGDSGQSTGFGEFGQGGKSSRGSGKSGRGGSGRGGSSRGGNSGGFGDDFGGFGDDGFGSGGGFGGGFDDDLF